MVPTGLFGALVTSHYSHAGTSVQRRFVEKRSRLSEILVMVRGNWQKRVEKAESRRQDSQLKKQMQENKRSWNKQVKEFLAQLDSFDESTKRKIINGNLHVWTDTLPSSEEGPPLLDVLDLDDVNKKKGKKERSTSIDESKGRYRSGSMGSSPKKKLHPRSKDTSTEEIQPPRMLLCRNGFFETCSRKTCKYVHFHSPYKTLSDIIVDKEVLENAKLAVTETIPELQEVMEPGALDMMLYHSTFPLQQLFMGSEEGALGDAVMKTLTAQQLSPHAIVYMSIDAKLAYDRFRGGPLFQDDVVLLAYLVGNPSLGRRRQLSVASTTGDESLLHLNAPILERILEYLPDNSVGAVSRVCRAWYRETGKDSPNLWRLMLERNQWPLPISSDSECQKDSYRSEFIRHFCALRNLRALQSAIAAIHHRQNVVDHDMCYQDFSKRKNVPVYPNTCISVHIWAKNQVLVAYGQDCSLRLFEAVASSDLKEKRCKELVYQCVDPYRSTKKRTCRLESVALDQNLIACLADVAAEGVEETTPILIVLQREQFLLGESSAALDFNGSNDDIEMDIIDVGECVLNYLLCSEEVDHRLLQLTDYLQDGGDLGSVDVAVLGNIASCGFGRFVVEVAISIPVPVAVTEEDSIASQWAMQLVDRKVVILSASAGAIIWMGEVWPVSQDVLSSHEVMHQCLKAPRTSSTKGHFTFGFSMNNMPPLVGKIEPSGALSCYRLLGEPGHLERHLAYNGGWELQPSRKHLAVMLQEGVFVIANAIRVSVTDDQTLVGAALTFYHTRSDKQSTHTKILGDNIEPIRLCAFSDAHILLLCRKCHLSQPDPLDLVRGQWFHDDATDEHPLLTRFSMEAIIYDAFSYGEIGRISILGNISGEDSDFPMISGTQTIGIAHSCRGAALTGRDVWNMLQDKHVINANYVSSKALEKKKKKKGRPSAPKKGSKKDGFARGMSLRG